MNNQNLIDRRACGISEGDDQDFVRMLAETGILKFREEPFPLKSGAKSHFYLDDRGAVTDSPDVAASIGYLFWKAVRAINADAGKKNSIRIIGLPTAATGHAAATQLFYAANLARAKERIRNQGIVGGDDIEKDRLPIIRYFIMREGLKGHGATGGRVVNDLGVPDHDAHAYFAFENVITSGKSILEKQEELLRDGYKLSLMHLLILMDRGTPKVWKNLHSKSHFASAQALYSLDEVIRSLCAIGYWPEKSLQAWETERAELVVPIPVANIE